METLKEIIYQDLDQKVGEGLSVVLGKTNLGRIVSIVRRNSQETPFVVLNYKIAVRLDKAEYLFNYDVTEYKLKPEDIADLTEFLKAKSEYDITNFKYLLIAWNYFNEYKTSEYLELPNYEELPEYSPKIRVRLSKWT